MTEKYGQPSFLIDSIPGNFVQQLTESECHEPHESKNDGRESIVNGEGVEGAIIGVESEETALISDLLHALLLLGQSRAAAIGHG